MEVGDSASDFELEANDGTKINLKLNETHSTDFGRIIFYTDDVDELFAYMQNDKTISGLGKLESKPQDATWGERFFHVLDPDGYKMSFATPLGNE